MASTDADVSWLVHIGDERVTTTAQWTDNPVEADCVVHAAACELYLALWNRCGADRLTVDGDPAVLDRFLDGVQIRWS